MNDQKTDADSTKRLFLRSTSAVPRRNHASSNTAYSRAKSVQDAQHTNQNRSSRSSIFILEDLVQCGICLDKLSEPRMLPCQHTFCFNCLQAHLVATTRRKIIKNCMSPSKEEVNTAIVEANNEIVCPTCQTASSVGKGFEGLQKLPNNMYIDSLLKLFEDASSLPSSPILAAPETRCVKCQTVCEFKEEHCSHCKQIFCKVCWSEHLQSLKNNLYTLIENLRESEVRLEHRVHDFNERCQKVGGNIQKVVDEMISEIKAKEVDSLNQLENMRLHEIYAAKTLKEHLGSTKTEIQLLKFDSIPNDKQKVDVFMRFHRETSKVLSAVSQMGETRLLFDPKTFKVKQTNELLNRTNSEEDENVADNGIIENPWENIETMAAYYLNRSFTPKLVWTKCPRPAGLGIPPWSKNLLYITATDRKSVLIMDRNAFKVIGKLTAPDMLYTQGITFSERLSEIYVTDKWKHCIHVFSNEGDYLRSLCTLGSGSSELRSPEGITINRRNQLVVADVGNDRVVLLDPMDGKHILTLGVHNNRTELQAPTGVAAYEDKIIVADNGNHRIKVYSDTGKKLLEFGSLGNGRGQFKTAEVVACGPLGFILVGDAGNGRIQVFKPDGTFLKTFGGYGEAPGKFSWISGLLVTPQLEIVATDYKNKRLQIF